jgi:hypothetical protein
MTSSARILVGGVTFAAFALALPLGARAGGPTFVHPVAITLKTVSQTTTNSGDLKPDPFTAKTVAVFEACQEATPTKTQGIFLMLNCDGLGNSIVAAETSPTFQILQTIGEVFFDMDFFVQTTKNLDTKSASVPVAITLDCNGSTTTVQLRGIMDLKYGPNTSGVGAPVVCPVSGAVKVVGSGVNSGVGDFLVDDGSSITIKKGTLP